MICISLFCASVNAFIENNHSSERSLQYHLLYVVLYLHHSFILFATLPLLLAETNCLLSVGDRVLQSGKILIPQMEVVPTGVIANPDTPPEIQLRFDMVPEQVHPEDENLPVNWQLKFLHNQLFKYFEFPSRFCPGPFHAPVVRRAEFRSTMVRKRHKIMIISFFFEKKGKKNNNNRCTVQKVFCCGWTFSSLFDSSFCAFT